MKNKSLNIRFTESAAKVPYVAHKLNLGDIHGMSKDFKPKIGDYIVARVTKLGHHKSIRNADNSEIRLYPGDLVVASYGNRYAVSELEAYVPEEFGPCQLLNAGGTAGTVTSYNRNLVKGATELDPIGFLLGGNGQPLNIKDYAFQPLNHITPASRPPVAIVWGTGMDTGKTTTCANLVRGFANIGKRVGFAKITGTANPKDLYEQLDAGAISAYDFLDFGYPSTYKVPVKQIEAGFATLMNRIQNDGADMIVIEVADGLLQDETNSLVASQMIRANCDGAFLAANGAHGATSATKLLLRLGYPVLGISGIISNSALSCQEIRHSAAVKKADVICYTGEALTEPGLAAEFVRRLGEAKQAKIVHKYIPPEPTTSIEAESTLG